MASAPSTGPRLTVCAAIPSMRPTPTRPETASGNAGSARQPQIGDDVAEPTPPTDVRLRYPDGRMVPVQCVYEGPDDDGIQVWRMVFPRTIGQALVAGELSITVATLPARTRLAFPLED